RRLAWNDGDLAGYSGHGRFVRRAAVPHLQLRQSMDRRYWRLAHLDGMLGAVSQSMGTAEAVDIAGVAQPRRFRPCAAGAQTSRPEAHHRPGLDVAPALDHRLRDPASLGNKLVQGASQSMGDLELS